MLQKFFNNLGVIISVFYSKKKMSSKVKEVLHLIITSRILCIRTAEILGVIDSSCLITLFN